MDISKRQKEKALEKAEELALNASDEKIEEAIEESNRFKDKKVIKAIWDKVQILGHIIRSPLFAKSLTIAAASALLYLVSPIDIIPDIIVGAGLLDDVFVLSTITASVIKNIKKNPEKALAFIDSLPEKLKGPATTMFGLAGGAYLGAKVGSKGGEWLKENSVEELYKKINPDSLNLQELIEEKKTETEKLVTTLLSNQIKKSIFSSFQKRLSRALSAFALFLLSILITLQPIAGEASKYIASFLLLVACSISLYAICITIKKIFPYIKASIKERSIVKGCESTLGREYKIYASGKKAILYATEKLGLSLELTKDEVKRLAKYLLKTFYKEAILFILGTLLIILSFILLRHGLIKESLNLTTIKLLLFPFFVN